jgi:hypothetical protein
VSVGLRDAVRRHRREWRLFRLRNLGRLSEDLARGRLVHADRVVDRTNRLEQRRHADGRELGRDDRLFPRRRDEGGRREVVDLVRAHVAQHVDERELVEQVRLDELDALANVVEVLEARRR